MADVGGDRGQLLLVTAISLAVLFVTLALVMNTVIYTENLATRSSKVAGGSEAVGYRSAVEAGIGGLITHVNYHNNTSHADLQSNLTTGVEDWTNATGKLYAQSGTVVNASLLSTENGTRIEQDGADRDFTNASESKNDWTLASNVNDTREFRINVTDDDHLEDFGDGDGFGVVVDDGSNTWRVNVTDNGGTKVGIENGTGDEFVCSVASDEPWINVTAGTVAGEECDGLDFAEGLTVPYSISFENGDNINGTYTLVVTNESLASNPGIHSHVNDDGSGSPYVTPATYSARIELVYQSPRLFFNTSVRVAPGEADG